MSDEKHKGGPYGPALSLQKVNNVGGTSPEIWIRGDNIGAPGSVYPDGTAPNSQLGCVKAGKNITIDADGTINASGGSGGSTDWSDITNKPTAFPPTAANGSTLGGVKQGTNITIAADGTISASGTLGTDWTNVTNKPFNSIGAGLTVTGGVLSANGGGGTVDWTDITDKPSTFPVAIAGQNQLGGVKVGAGLNVDLDGTLTADATAPTWSEVQDKPATFPVAPATKSALGGVIAGAGVNIDAAGTISVSSAAPSWNDITGKPATFIPPIATDRQLGGVKEGAGINIEADGTINTVQAAPYWNEVLDKPATFPVAIATNDSLGGVIAGNGVFISEAGEISVRTTPPAWDEVTDKPAAFNPVIASATTLGGVKQGTNISIEPDGTINAAAIDIPIASAYTLGAVKIGNGISVQEDGTIGTEAAAPYWTEIIGKPEEFPPTVAADGVVGGIMPDDYFTISPSGVLSAKPFAGRSFAVVQYDDSGRIIPSYTMENRNGNVILGGTQPTMDENGKPTGEEITFGGGVTLLDKSGKYRFGIINDSLDYTLAFTNGPNIKAGFLPFVTQVVGEVVSVGFGSIVDAIGYASLKNLGIVQVGQNIDVDSKGVISVKTANKSELGLMIAGANLNVDKGVVTPAKATTESPGIVQIGTGLSVDEAGVLSTTNTIAFVNRVVITNNGYNPTETTWTLPEGVDYFRVRTQGAGGNAGYAADDANKGPGGGGGGGGAYMEAMFFGYKFPAGQVFNIYCGVPGTGPSGGRAEFRSADGKTGIGGGGGGGAQSGSDPGPQSKGFALGGTGGKPIANGTNLALMQPPIQAVGGDGMPGLSVQTPKGYKTLGGAGGASYMNPGCWGGYGGSGNGTTGAGEANGETRLALAGGSLVIIEW